MVQAFKLNDLYVNAIIQLIILGWETSEIVVHYF